VSYLAATAVKAAEPFRRMLSKPIKVVPIVSVLAEQFKLEKMSTRASTSHSIKAWLKNHIIPAWGEKPITDLQARPVDLWLKSLPLSPKSKVHIRGVIRELWEYAMYRDDVEVQRNPMELVRIKGATKRLRKPRCLTVEEFQSSLPNWKGLSERWL